MTRSESGTSSLITHHFSRSVRENAGGVPGAVGAAGEIVAKEAMVPRDSAPMAGGVTPRVHAGERRFEDILTADDRAPRLGHDFRSAPTPQPDSFCRKYDGDQIGMMLLPLTGLPQAVPAGMSQKGACAAVTLRGRSGWTLTAYIMLRWVNVAFAGRSRIVRTSVNP